MSRRYSLDDKKVVVVIGSGAGGGTVAHELSRRGIDVVCLEAGGRLGLKEIVNDEAAMFPRFTWLDERIGEGDLPADFPVWGCKTVGGTTMHWTAACPRFLPHEFKVRTTYGALPGANLADWPFDQEELNPWYDRAEDVMGVAGTHGIPPMGASNNSLVLMAGARNLGYTQVDTGHVAINPAPRDGRAGCLQLGFCTSGCATGAKWSTTQSEIPKAEKTGNFELRTGCMAVKLETDGNRVNAVRYRDAGGRERVQRTRTVCVAGNVVETTRLLLNSAPGGLANSSGELGRNYMRHVMVGVVAVMPGPVDMHKGAQVCGIVRDEMRHDPSRGFAGGFQLHTCPFTPETLAKLMLPTAWGRTLADTMAKYRNMAALLIMGEDAAQPDNRVTLHPSRKDRNGLPVPIVTYRKHENSRVLLEYAKAKAHALYESLGATEIYDMEGFPSTHNMGTARMGDDPRRFVCDRWGRTHDLENLYVSDGSVFTSASSANPTLTIVALALRQADHLACRLERGEL
ncbi:MAG TPA: GMC family oxidoreductase [Gammaproteobacteria bacterium]